MTLLRSREHGVGGAADGPPSRRLLLWLCLAVVLVRATFVRHPLRSDEGGYLLAARRWDSGGEFLYGDYFVDRPPLLMAVFRVAALTEWDRMIRVIAIPFAVLFVLAAWRAGRLLAGGAGARWSAFVAAALMCSPAVSADMADGELFAVALVMPAIALALGAWSAESRERTFWSAVAAGVLAGAAPLTKQNFLDGLVFIGLLVVGSAWARRRVGPREVQVGAGALLGLLVPAGAVLVWMGVSGLEPGDVWWELAGFRQAALEVIWANSVQAPAVRGLALLLLGLAGGLVAIVLAWLESSRPWRGSRTPEHLAVSGVLLYGLVGIIAGGSYWPHYLLQLAPGAVLAAGLVAPGADRAGRWMRVAAWWTAGAAVVGALVLVAVYVAVPRMWFQQRTGEWLAASSSPGDTAVVAYGHAAVLESADLSSPYPYLWSLPMRTTDPRQERLRATLAGPRSPTWIVQADSLDSWDIDAGSRLRDLVHERYRIVAEICGNPVWLRQDLARRTAPLPQC